MEYKRRHIRDNVTRKAKAKIYPYYITIYNEDQASTKANHSYPYTKRYCSHNVVFFDYSMNH